MADSVTISLLPVPLALVHIPRTRLPALSHPILRHILHPSPTFFTVTANELEISLFVDYEHVHDFHVIAKKDRHSMCNDPVEISYELWSVLQIDSHSDQYDNSGARVNELSGPLAAAGISILYQSSYMCDFIFVKESRLQEALTLFETAGFDLYASNMLSSPSLSQQPTSPTNASSPTVLTLTQPTILSTHSSTPTSCLVTPNGRVTVHHVKERTKSHSPTSGEVRMLDPVLACVGLSDELGVDHWGLKIVKLVAFPELIPTFTKNMGKKSSLSSFSSCSSLDVDGDDDGYFSHSPHSVSTSELNLAPNEKSVEPSRSSSSSRPSSAHSASRISFHSEGGLSPINTNLFSDTSNPMTLSPSLLIPPSDSNAPPHHFPINQPPSSSSATLHVPFFSFTRTQEGSSLTADVRTLAALFSPEERHLISCCNSLDFGSGHEGKLDDEGVFGGDEETLVDGMDEMQLSDVYEDDEISSGELKCLQIDLRKFGLDKYGLLDFQNREYICQQKARRKGASTPSQLLEPPWFTMSVRPLRMLLSSAPSDWQRSPVMTLENDYCHNRSHTHRPWSSYSRRQGARVISSPTTVHRLQYDNTSKFTHITYAFCSKFQEPLQPLFSRGSSSHTGECRWDYRIQITQYSVLGAQRQL